LGGTADSARARAERELRANPRRGDAMIAIAANCTPRPVGRWRRELAASGVIEAIEPSQRTVRVRTWRARLPRLAIEQGRINPRRDHGPATGAGQPAAAPVRGHDRRADPHPVRLRASST